MTKVINYTSKHSRYWSAEITTVINTIIAVQISRWRHLWRGAEVGEEQLPHNTQLAA